jgi:allantoin racemase
MVKNIAILIPASFEERTKEYFSSALNEYDNIDFVFLREDGIIPPETWLQGQMHIPNVVERMRSIQNEYDIIIQSCHGDTGVIEAQQTVDSLVLGPGRVGLSIATLLGDKISVLVPSQDIIDWIEFVYRKQYGFENEIVSITSIGKNVDEMMDYYLAHREDAGIPSLVETAGNECINAIENDDATAIVMGCDGFTWLGPHLNDYVTEKGYTIPVINPLPLTIELSKTIHDLGLSFGYPQL